MNYNSHSYTSPPEESKHTPSGNNEEKKDGPHFECNICLETPVEPVVTKCGHLFCWPCIHNWMNQNKETLLCPVCKSGISPENIIPLYSRGGNTADPRAKDIPKRPNAQRTGPIPNQNFQGFPAGNGGFQFGFGVFPGLFAFNMGWGDLFGGINQRRNRNLTPEEEQQKKLSKILLIYILIAVLSFFLFGRDNYFFII